MLKNKQSMRSMMSFMVTWSFLTLTITGEVYGSIRNQSQFQSQQQSQLGAAGIPAKADESAREIVDRHELSPIDPIKIVLLPEGE